MTHAFTFFRRLGISVSERPKNHSIRFLVYYQDGNKPVITLSRTGNASRRKLTQTGEFHHSPTNHCQHHLRGEGEKKGTSPIPNSDRPKFPISAIFRSFGEITLPGPSWDIAEVPVRRRASAESSAQQPHRPSHRRGSGNRHATAPTAPPLEPISQLSLSIFAS
jgi:hypothetical protein